MRTMIAAMLTVATLIMPAISSAQDYDHRDRQYDHRDGDRRDGDRRDGDRRDGDRGYDRHDGDRRDFRDGDRRDIREARREDRFDAGRYSGPRGYAYRSWNVGNFFPRDYYDRRFWIGNPYAYRLPVAHGGARWVRYGPDALLIRLRDGAVLQVIPNRFY